MPEIKDMTLAQVNERLAKLDEEVRAATKVEDVERAAEEKKNLLARKAELEQLEQRKSIALGLAAGVVTGTVLDTRGALTADPQDVRATPEYRNAFFKRMLGRALTEVEERAYSSATGSAAAAIPTQTADILFDKMVKIAPMLGEITLLRVAGNVKFVTEGVRNAAARHTENAAATAAADTTASVELGGFEYIKLIQISKTVSSMSIPAFENWLVTLLAEDLAVAIENDIINSDGSSAPKGVEYAATWTAATNAIDYDTGVTYDNIVDLIGLLPARYDANAKFLMNKKFLYGSIAKIKDDNKNPILVKDVVNGLQLRIMGYPVLISDKVANGVAYLGDFRKIVGNLPMDIEIAASDQAGFVSASTYYRGLAIFDCDISLADAFVKLFT